MDSAELSIKQDEQGRQDNKDKNYTIFSEKLVICFILLILLILFFEMSYPRERVRIVAARTAFIILIV